MDRHKRVLRHFTGLFFTVVASVLFYQMSSPKPTLFWFMAFALIGYLFGWLVWDVER